MPTSKKWRIEFSGAARSTGEFSVRLLAPEDEMIADVSTKIAQGMSENTVARRVSEELKIALPPDRYSVEVDDGEDVLVKRRRGVADFEIRLIGNSVVGVRIVLDRE